MAYIGGIPLNTITEVLYKKYLGIADSSPGASPAVEKTNSARPRVIASLQLFQQTIPTIAPSDLVKDGSFTNADRWTSQTYPYIAYYSSTKLAPITATPTTFTSYWYTTAITNQPTTNILSPAIPTNFDAAGSYAITVNSVGSNPIGQYGDNPWIFDPDAGILTFFNPIGTGLAPPTITFWRYEGTFGIGTGLDTTALISSVAGLGSAGYISTLGLNASLRSTVVGLGTAGYISSATFITSLLTSTVVGLGTAGYVSTTSLYSTVASLGTSGYISTSGLTSTVQGLGTAGYISSATFITSLTSTVQGLGTAGYVSTTSLYSTVNSLGTQGYISTSGLTSTVQGLGTAGYISSLTLTTSLTSTVQGLGTAGYISSATFTTSLTSTVQGLGTAGYVSTTSLYSTVNSLGTQGYISTSGLISTVQGLGTAGYISTLTLINSLTSTVQGLGTYGYISTPANGGNTVFTDTWFQSNIINPPSSIFFQTPVSRASQIFIPWVYPTQSNVGFQGAWLPVISSMSAILSTNVFSPAYSTIINNGTQGYVLKNSGDSYINGIVINKIKGVSGIQPNVTFPDATTRNAYVYYETALATLQPANNQCIAWYNNYNLNFTMASTIFGGFLAAHGPTIPQNITLDIGTAITCNAIRLYFSTPQQSDSNDAGSVLTIKSYDVSYNSIPFGTYRYGTAVYDASAYLINSPFTFTGPNIYTTMTNLYPDSVYNIAVSACNSADLLGKSTFLNNITTSSLGATAPISGTLSFTARYYGGTIKRLKDDLTITTLVNDGSTDWPASFVAPILNSNSRGTTLTTRMTMSTCLVSPTQVPGPIITYDGFPATIPGVQTNNGMRLRPDTVYDKYGLLGCNSQYQGFYLDSSDTVTLMGANAFVFTNNSTIYTLNVNQTLYNALALSPVTGQTTFSYYYDAPPGTPTPTITNFSYTGIPNAPTSTAVSGVYVIAGTPTFSTIFTTGNMGNWFYTNPFAIYTNTNASNTNTCNENSPTKIVAGLTRGQFTGTLTVQNTLTSGALTSFFYTSMPLTVTASNFAANATSATNTLYTIIDGPSYAYMTNGTSNPVALPTAVLSNNSFGMRIWSSDGYDNSIYTTAMRVPSPPYSNLTNTSYTTCNYDNTNTSLPSGTYCNELQYFNGGFRSKGTTSQGYLDYTNTYVSGLLQNTANYSAIPATGYRFVTFGWKLPTNSSGIKQFAAPITFIITATSGSTMPTGFPLTFGDATSNLLVLYRIENNDTPHTKLVPSDATSPTTVWLDANASIGSLNATNYFTYPGSLYGANTTNSITGTYTITLGVFITPSMNIPTMATNVNVICRIGVPMSVDFGIQSVTAKFIEN